MPLNIQGDTNQGYLQINGSTAVTVTSTGITTASIQDSAITTAKLAQPLTLATSVASTSGTAIDFTGIPSWAKKVTVMFSGVSLSGTDNIIIQLGTSSGVTTSGYLGAGSAVGTTTAGSNYTSGFGINSTGSANLINGFVALALLTSNTWVASGCAGLSNAGFTIQVAGSIALAGTLDRVRITRTGTDTFDAGSINIMYEG